MIEVKIGKSTPLTPMILSHGEMTVVKGKDGRSPYINEQTGTWMIYDDNTGEFVDSEIGARGVSGYSPYINEQTNTWWSYDVETQSWYDTEIAPAKQKIKFSDIIFSDQDFLIIDCGDSKEVIY